MNWRMAGLTWTLMQPTNKTFRCTNLSFSFSCFATNLWYLCPRQKGGVLWWMSNVRFVSNVVTLLVSSCAFNDTTEVACGCDGDVVSSSQRHTSEQSLQHTPFRVVLRKVVHHLPELRGLGSHFLAPFYTHGCSCSGEPGGRAHRGPRSLDTPTRLVASLKL